MLKNLAIALLLTTGFCCQLCAWPMHRGNESRTGFTTEKLPGKLLPTWSRQFSTPVPAWPRSDRMSFDRCHEPIIHNELVVFGDSVTGVVYALNSQNGKEQWRFFTAGPIRFAPVGWKDRLFVVSDDGFLYCLASSTGELLWRKRGGPSDKKLLGNERMISKWPARGGPLVVDDTLYFAAGIWPSEGIYLYALSAESGETIWENDDSGGIYMAQPHGGANAKSGVSAQGYLVANADQLFVPTGRAVPAVFDRKTGKFQYFHLQKYGHNGGAQTMAIGDMFFNSGLSFRSDTGVKEATLGGLVAATADGLVTLKSGVLNAYRWVEKDVVDRRGEKSTKKVLEPLWTVKEVRGGASLIVADDKIVSGGNGQVDIVDSKKQEVVQSLEVEGVAYGLAVHNGRLVVSADLGTVQCFSAEKSAKAKSESKPAKAFEPSPRVAAVVEKIVAESKTTAGFCIDLGCGSGDLAIALARKTDLQIVAIDDADTAQKLRERLLPMNLLGSRITVLEGELANTNLPKYFANLIVSGRSVEEQHDFDIEVKKEIARLQRPYGGVACFGPEDEFTINVRGDLKGAGQWTHQYAGPGNSLNSGDSLLGGSLGMLWFRDVDFDVPQRHGRAPAPLSSQGRLIHEGMNGVIAVDAYNGRELWRYEIKGLLSAYNGDELMGVAGTGGNCCLLGDSVYVRNEDYCLRLSAATGELLGKFHTPHKPDEKPLPWGHIAAVGDTLIGSVADPEHVVTYRYRGTTGDLSRLLTESKVLFAMDAKTGDLKWRYDADDSIRHNAIAIGGELVFLIDRPQAKFDRVKKPTGRSHPLGKLIALNIENGEEIWSTEEDIYGTTLALSETHNALLMSYQPTRFRLDSEVGGRLGAFQLKDGKPLWDKKASYESRPMINDRTVYTQGGAWDLLTGEPEPFVFKRSYGCGVLSGCKDLLLFRSATLGYYDLSGSKMTENYGGMRPGCWVNAIPACGIVMVPDASAGCACSYLNKAWIALESQE